MSGRTVNQVTTLLSKMAKTGPVTFVEMGITTAKVEDKECVIMWLIRSICEFFLPLFHFGFLFIYDIS